MKEFKVHLTNHYNKSYPLLLNEEQLCLLKFLWENHVIDENFYLKVIDDSFRDLRNPTEEDNINLKKFLNSHSISRS